MYILRLLDREGEYVDAISRNYTGEWVEEVVTTHNTFKAKEYTEFTLDRDFDDIQSWIREHRDTLVEIVRISI